MLGLSIAIHATRIGQGAGKEGLKLLSASSHFLAKKSEKMPILIKEWESA